MMCEMTRWMPLRNVVLGHPNAGVGYYGGRLGTVASSSESITPLHLTRQNLSLLISASNLVFFTAIDSLNGAVSILANGVF